MFARITRTLTRTLAIVLLLSAPPVAAHPLTIRDARLDEVRGSAAIGRGYGLATNAIYASCLRDAPLAVETSFDLDFSLLSLRTAEDIEQLDDEGERVLRAHLQQLTRERRPHQSMLARLTITSRRGPIDESRQLLAPAVIDLLAAGRTSAFVAVCGTYYVRSIQRRSSLYILFTYEAPRTDDAFERQLSTALRSFDLDSARSQIEADDAAAVDALAEARELRITAFSVGMKARPQGTIAFDIASYRKMLDESFRASQSDEVGIPEEMEIAAWTSHPQIAHLWLDASTVPASERYTRRQIIRETSEAYLALLARLAELPPEVPDRGPLERCIAELERTELTVRCRAIPECRQVGEPTAAAK